MHFTAWLWTLHAPAQAQTIGRFASVEIKKDQDRLKHWLLVSGKAMFDYEGQSIDVFSVVTARNTDYAVVAAYSGGIACPVKVVILEIQRSGEHKVSPQFGSCNEPAEVDFVNGRVVVEMAVYVPHLELVPKNQLRKMQRTKEVYSWYKGKITRALAPR